MDKGVQLHGARTDDNLPDRQVKTGWSNGEIRTFISATRKRRYPCWVLGTGDYVLTFTADDGLLKSSKTLNVSVKEAAGKIPADYCNFGGGTMDVKQGKLNVVKSNENQLAIGDDGFLGPFANEGDSVSWQVNAPWAGKFALHVKFNAKWGGKKTHSW